MFILRPKKLVSVQVLYYIPKSHNILNEFFWQTEDLVPEYYRIHKFLNYWKDNIEATIHTVNVEFADNGFWRNSHFDEKI